MEQQGVFQSAIRGRHAAAAAAVGHASEEALGDDAGEDGELTAAGFFARRFSARGPAPASAGVAVRAHAITGYGLSKDGRRRLYHGLARTGADLWRLTLE